MSNILFYLLNVLLNFVEVFTLFQLGNCFFTYQGKRKALPLALFLMTLTYIGAILLANGNLLLKLALLITTNTLWLHYLYKAHPIKCIAVVVFGTSLMLLSDNLFLVGFSLLFGANTSSIHAGSIQLLRILLCRKNH